jgi:hypothetical protein
MAFLFVRIDPLPKIFSETEGRKVLYPCRMRGIEFVSSGLQTLISSLLLGHGCLSVPSSRLELRLRRLGRFRQIFLAMGLSLLIQV